MRILAALLALVSPVSAGQFFSIFPDPHFVTVPFVVQQGITGAFAGPAFQVINTGAGNALEAYVTGYNNTGFYLANSGVVTSSGNAWKGATISTHSVNGFVEMTSGIFNPGFDGGVFFGQTSVGNQWGGIWWDDNIGVSIMSKTKKFDFTDAIHFSPRLELDIDDQTSDPTRRAAVHWTNRYGSPNTVGFMWDNNPGLAVHTEWVRGTGGVTAISMMKLADDSGVATLFPSVDNTGALGMDTMRWARIRATVVVTGDLGFDDEACAICGKPFLVGEDVSWRIRRQVGKVSYAVPIHAGEK